MPTPNLSSYASVQSNLFVKIELDYTDEILLFSDNLDSVTIGSDTYVGLGQLMGVSAVGSDIKNTDSQVTITISGIPNSSLQQIMNSRIKGSKVIIYRVFFNPVTRMPLSIDGNPAGRFSGYVNNYSLSEELTPESRSATNTISIECTGLMNILANTTKGRRTNPADMNFWYPGDKSMDRVPGLVGAYWNFGATE
jgi:hypothetical protein